MKPIAAKKGLIKLPLKNNSHRIFLSHAAADKSVVEVFETLLSKSLGLTSADIFCSSLEGQGAPKGESFVDAIRVEAAKADSVVALISPAYLDSAFCMAELGAAWVLKTKRLPIVVPPNTFAVMEATLLGIVGVKIDDQIALAQAFEELAASMGITPPAIGVRQRAMREFQRAWEASKDAITASSRIEASIHAKIVRERDEALIARDAAEEELSTAEAKIAALRKAKDAASVAAIDEEFDESDWEDQLDEKLGRIRDLYSELGGREIVRLLILDHFGKFFRPDFDNFPDESGRAIALDVYDEENKKWNYGHPEVKELTSLIDEVIDIFDENPDAARSFAAKSQKNDPRNIRFWEEQL